MKLDDIEEAASLKRSLTEIGMQKEFFADRKVLAVKIGSDRANDAYEFTDVARGGSGLLSGLKLDAMIVRKLQDALLDWISEREYRAKERLKQLGVTVDG